MLFFFFFFFYQLRYIVSGRIFLPHTAISIEVSYVKRPSERHQIVRKRNRGEMLTEEERQWEGVRTGRRDGREEEEEEGGSRAGQISVARVVVAFLIWRARWDCQMWNKHAGHLECTHTHTLTHSPLLLLLSRALSLYMPLLIRQCSLLFAAAAFTTLILFT